MLTRASDDDPLNRIETGLQAEFLNLAVYSKQVFSTYNDHHIQIADPELVIEAIREMVEQVS